MSNNWKVQCAVNGEEGDVLPVDAYAFIKSFNSIFSVFLEYLPDNHNVIVLIGNSIMRFEYNDPSAMPEICEMLRNVDFVELHIGSASEQSDKTELYEKAVIIYSKNIWLEEYAEKCIPYRPSKWKGEYDNRLKYTYAPGFDLSRVRNVSFNAKICEIPDDIEDYQFYSVYVSDITDMDKLLKINAEVLDINFNEVSSPEDWHRLLEKAKYITMRTSDTFAEPPELICPQLLAYNISDDQKEHITWDELDEICEANRPKSGGLKSARNI